MLVMDEISWSQKSIDHMIWFTWNAAPAQTNL